MNKEFIPYEQALALKELGFDEPCFKYWYAKNKTETPYLTYTVYDGELYEQDFNTPFEGNQIRISAPTFSKAFRWFREKYVLLGFIEPANGYEDKSLFAFYICDDEQNIVDDSHSYSKDSSLHFRTYEEAEIACLKKLIEIVKEKL
jgi:hypothetical protein